MSNLDIKPGLQIRIETEVQEAKRAKITTFDGVVIAVSGKGAAKTFTVRRIAADNVAVERIFPVNSPLIKAIKPLKSLNRALKVKKVRRAKLYFLRR